MVYKIYTDPEDHVMSSLLVCSRREGSSIGFRVTFSEAPMLDFVPDSALTFARGFYTLLRSKAVSRPQVYQSRENTTTVVIV